MKKKPLEQQHFFYRNGLSLVFLLLMILSLAGQVFFGWKEHNTQLLEEHQQQVSLAMYLISGHFLQATFENWESEFLQMFLFVVFTIFLYQKGSSESKVPGDTEEKEKGDELAPKPHSPWPVKKGGIVLVIYKHSLSISLFLLFFFSFVFHWYGSWKDFNEQQMFKGEPLESFYAYLSSTRFWFESFQNWQSEFLSVFAIIFLSIYLRQIGSSQSKAVNAAHDETGE